MNSIGMSPQRSGNVVKKLQPKGSKIAGVSEVKGVHSRVHIKNAVAETASSPPPSRHFPIVAIGASAGGLEALEQFLGHVPADSGMAYVVIQHLDPNYKGIMPELLQRITAMPVAQVKNRTKVMPDHVYVIPPNKDISILHGILYLLDPIAPRGLRLPIDFFFRALADDMQINAIGIILSGMGSDGTPGVRAIKEKGGLILVQYPASSKFDSMPRSAIDTALVDIVDTADQLPLRIFDYFSHAKEEMQSLNEELQTVNIELQSKVDELSGTNNDMKNLLNSTDIATIFLDNALQVRRFTNHATRLFKKIMPYRTLENVIDGVVITCNDISASKRLEAELRTNSSKS